MIGMNVVKASALKRRKRIDHMLTVLVGPEENIYRYRPLDIVNSVVASLVKNRQRDSMILFLRQVSPSDWELMLKVIDPKCDQKQLSLADAARLKLSFDTYGFKDGVKLCDEVLKAQP